MKQEDKELLLKDLCSRLPYGVKIALKNNGSYHHDNVAKKGDITIDILKGFTGSYFSIYHNNPLDWDWYDDDIDIEDIKPYLFPLSSMTKEQKKEFDTKTFEIFFGEAVCKKNDEIGYGKLMAFDLDFYNKHHLDWRGLIPKGLAIDTTDKNIY